MPCWLAHWSLIFILLQICFSLLFSWYHSCTRDPPSCWHFLYTFFSFLMPVSDMQECSKDNLVNPSLPLQIFSFVFYLLISLFFSPSLMPSPSISPPGDPIEMCNCSENVYSELDGITQRPRQLQCVCSHSRTFVLVTGARLIHRLGFIFLFFDSFRLYIIEPVKMLDWK